MAVANSTPRDLAMQADLLCILEKFRAWLHDSPNGVNDAELIAHLSEELHETRLACMERLVTLGRTPVEGP